jgi:hypothetical protein
VRKIAKRDANHPEIVTALEQAMCSVVELHQLGDGVPDLLVGNHLVGNVLMEIKTDDGELSPAQVTFHREWRGPIVTVRNVDEALAAVGLGSRPSSRR